MAGTQAQRPTISPHEGTSATRFRTNRTTAQHSQSTVITTTQSGSNSQLQLQSQQYANTIGCSSNSGNGSTIAISTITTAPHHSRVSDSDIAFHDCAKNEFRWHFIEKRSSFSFWWIPSKFIEVCFLLQVFFFLLTQRFSHCSNYLSHHKCYNSHSTLKSYSTMTTTMLSKLPLREKPPSTQPRKFDIDGTNVRFIDVSLIT